MPDDDQCGDDYNSNLTSGITAKIARLLVSQLICLERFSNEIQWPPNGLSMTSQQTQNMQIEINSIF